MSESLSVSADKAVAFARNVLCKRAHEYVEAQGNVPANDLYAASDGDSESDVVAPDQYYEDEVLTSFKAIDFSQMKPIRLLEEIDTFNQKIKYHLQQADQLTEGLMLAQRWAMIKTKKQVARYDKKVQRMKEHNAKRRVRRREKKERGQAKSAVALGTAVNDTQ